MSGAIYYSDMADFVRTDEQLSIYLTNGISKVIEFFTALFSPRVVDSNYEVDELSQPSYVSDNRVIIDKLHSEKFILKKPMCITIEVLAEDEYIAELEDAGIAFSGSTASEAVRELEIELIEAYELYKAEKRLGAWPRQQLAVLECYIGKKQ